MALFCSVGFRITLILQWLTIALSQTQVPLTNTEKQVILARHNAARNAVAKGTFPGRTSNLPPATNMNQLLWVCQSLNYGLIPTNIIIIKNNEIKSDHRYNLHTINSI